MSRFIWILFSLVFLFGACKDNEPKIKSEKRAESQAEDVNKKIVPDGDYNYQMDYIEKLDSSQLDIIYRGKRLGRYRCAGKIVEEFLVDLDSDKANEIYLVTTKNGSKLLHGFQVKEGVVQKINKRSYRKSIPRKISDIKLIRNQIVERYQNQLVNGQVIISESRYNLVQDGKDAVLLPEGFLPSELKKMGGQYAERDATGVGYYKIMELTQLLDLKILSSKYIPAKSTNTIIIGFGIGP